MTVVIGPATLADVSEIAGIEESEFSDPWSANSFRALPGDPRVLFACARSGVGDGGGAATGPAAARGAGRGVLGYVVAIFAADEGEIGNLAVVPAARGQGIGGQLLDAVLAEAERRGCVVLYLEVRESNAAARQLYASRGFEDAGRRRGYYQRPVEDALLLRRTVEPRLK